MAVKQTIRLGRRELEIMNVVWDLGEATVQDVCDRLKRPAAYSTVLTMMRTLETKGGLRHRVRRRTYVYRPEVSREEIRSSMLLDLRDTLFGGSETSLVNCLVRQDDMGPKQRAELRALLERADAEGNND